MPSTFEDPVAQAPQDEWESLLYECSFGGVRIDVLSASDTGGRVLATYESPHRDGAHVEDMGAEPRVTRCRLIFFRVSRDDSPTRRFAEFLALVRKGQAQTFTHPITGSYTAFVGEFNYAADAEPREVITADVSFHEHSEEPAVFEIGPGAPTILGVEEVTASAADVDASIAEYNAGGGALDTDLTTEAVSTVTAWSDASVEEEGVSLTSVHHDLISLSNRIQDLTDEWELATDIDRYPIMVSLINFHATLRRAAQAVIEDTPRIFEIRVGAPTPLYQLAARTYGADEAEARFEQLLRLNAIRNPARIEAGTVLKAQSPTQRRRLAA